VQHEALALLRGEVDRLVRCSSCGVPSVTTPSDCVCPRVKSAEPCARGSSPSLDRDRADVVEPAAVGADALAQDHLAHLALLDLLEDRADVAAGLRELLGELLGVISVRIASARAALVLVGDLQRLAHPRRRASSTRSRSVGSTSFGVHAISSTSSSCSSSSAGCRSAP
jgi:hypothetical protein